MSALLWAPSTIYYLTLTFVIPIMGKKPTKQKENAPLSASDSVLKVELLE